MKKTYVNQITKCCYRQILARKNKYDKWQSLTGLIKNRTRQFMIDHCREHFVGMDYEFALYTRRDRESFIERIYLGREVK